MRSFVAGFALVLALVVGPVAVAAAPCPIWLSGAAAASPADVYALTFASAERGQATLRLQLFAKDRAYEATIPDVPFATKRPSGSGTAEIDDAAPVFVRLPDGPAALDGASLAIVDPDTKAALACSGRNFSLAELSQLPPSPVRDAERARAAARTFRPGTATVSATSVAAPAARCAHPYVPAAIVGRAATLDYPAVAREQGQTGTSLVAVELDPAGKILGTDLFATSGFPALDAATQQAATQTKYAAEIFRCDPVAGIYLFQATFSRT